MSIYFNGGDYMQNCMAKRVRLFFYLLFLLDRVRYAPVRPTSVISRANTVLRLLFPEMRRDGLMRMRGEGRAGCVLAALSFIRRYPLSDIFLFFGTPLPN